MCPSRFCGPGTQLVCPIGPPLHHVPCRFRVPGMQLVSVISTVDDVMGVGEDPVGEDGMDIDAPAWPPAGVEPAMRA
eukprot:jgi/Tetstr1/420690/TSEL_011775.t1